MSKKQQQIRMLLVREAARLMVKENVTQHLDAKKLAAKRLFGKPFKNLPSNKEVADAVPCVYQMAHLLNAETPEQYQLSAHLIDKTLDTLRVSSTETCAGRIMQLIDILVVHQS